MAQTISIRIDIGSQGDAAGSGTGIASDGASGGALPMPTFTGVAHGADHSTLGAPTPLLQGTAQAAQADMAAPQPSPDFLPGGHAMSAALPTPFSGGAAATAPESAQAMSVPTPMDSMVPAAAAGSGDQAPMPSPHMQPDDKVSGGPAPKQGNERKANK